MSELNKRTGGGREGKVVWLEPVTSRPFMFTGAFGGEMPDEIYISIWSYRADYDTTSNGGSFSRLDITKEPGSDSGTITFWMVSYYGSSHESNFENPWRRVSCTFKVSGDTLSVEQSYTSTNRVYYSYEGSACNGIAVYL